MTYLMHMDSPVGPLHLASDGQAITGLWLEGQKYFAATLEPDAREGSLSVFDSAKAWLEAYFAKAPLPPLPPLSVKAAGLAAASTSGSVMPLPPPQESAATPLLPAGCPGAAAP